MASVKVVHFSDILCVWAHVGQANVSKMVQEFGSDVEIEVHFCSVFPDTQTKIGKQWETRGGFGGYGDHVKSVAAQFDGFEIHPDAWNNVQPRSSASPHLFVKAIELIEKDSGPTKKPFLTRTSVQAAAALRTAFFTEGQDISNWQVQRVISKTLGLEFESILQRIETGEALASLAADYDLAHSQAIQGSPTYVLNEGRQRLFGNVGYRILSANISELLEEERDENASLCS